MARPATLPDQARAVEHLPTSLPAIQVTWTQRKMFGEE